MVLTRAGAHRCKPKASRESQRRKACSSRPALTRALSIPSFAAPRGTRGPARRIMSSAPGSAVSTSTGWIRNSNAEPVVVSRQELLARKQLSGELVSFADAEMAQPLPAARRLRVFDHSHRPRRRPAFVLRRSELQTRRVSAPDSCRGRCGASGTGTNGMGTCLLEHAPVIIHREQHFLARNTGLTCCRGAHLRPPRRADRGAGRLWRVGPRAAAHVGAGEHVGADDREPPVPAPVPRRLRGALPQPAGACRHAGARDHRVRSRGAISAVDRNALFQLGCKTADDRKRRSSASSTSRCRR